MNHLRTEQERKDRWYARHLRPRPVDVREARNWRELRLPEVRDEGGSPGDCCYDYSARGVCSLPFAWLDPSDEADGGSGGETVREQMLASLDSHGFLVVSGVLSLEECQAALDLAWDWLEAASAAESSLLSHPCGGVGRSTHSASGDSAATEGAGPSLTASRHSRSSLQKSWCFPKGVEGGIQPFHGSGHSTFAWSIRSHPNVVRVFAALHNAPRLLASLDGIILWRPPSSSENDVSPAEESDAGWFHVDQNPRWKPGRAGIQGLVNLLPVNASTGGNALVAQSHHQFPGHFVSTDGGGDLPVQGSPADFYRRRLDEVGTEDWLEIDPGDAELLIPSRILSLRLAPGDVLLWDSRLVHCSYPPREPETPSVARSHHGSPAVATFPRPLHSGGLVRAAALVSMIPADGAGRPTLRGRRQACRDMRTLTHWVDKAATLGGERPEEVALESHRVAAMKRWEALRGTKVLLEWEDLSHDQRRLVVGDSYVEEEE